MEPIYFNTFEEYENNLELVKYEIQEDQPSWLHYWFYRYLQVSPYYWAMHLNQSKSKEEKDRYKSIKKYNNDWEKCDDLCGKDGIKIFSPERPTTAYKFLGDVWSIDFARWWYTRARYFFKHVSYFIDKEEIKRTPFLHGGIDTRMAANKKFISSWSHTFENSLQHLAKEGGYPKAIVITTNFLESKRATVRAFSNFIDRMYGVEFENMNSTNFSFTKTKLKESTLRNCYKIYEMSIRQEKLNLFDLGIKAEVLRGAIAEYKSKRNIFEKNIKIFRSYNSLKSATSRQIRYAKNLAINAGIPQFPNKREFNWVSIELPIEEKRYIFDLLVKQAKLTQNQKGALLDFAKKEKLKDTKKEYNKIISKLD
jgi:hypothetical protein